MQRATPWFVGPAIHGARAAQLLSRSRAHSRERARRAHTGAQQIDAQRSRLIAHSLPRLECRLPLMANKFTISDVKKKQAAQSTEGIIIERDNYGCSCGGARPTSLCGGEETSSTPQ